MSKLVEAPLIDHFLQRVVADRKEEIDFVGAHHTSSRDWALLYVAPRRPLENPRGLGTFSADGLNNLATTLFEGFEHYGSIDFTPAWYDGDRALHYPTTSLRFPRDSVVSMGHTFDLDPQLLSQAVLLPEVTDVRTGRSVIQVDIIPHALIGPSILEPGQNPLMPVEKHSRAIPLRSIAYLQNILAATA